MRMIGGSILVLYEGDIRMAKEMLERCNNNGLGSSGGDEGGEEDISKSRTFNGSSELCTVKLIDFAQTTLVPGEGPDQGVLKGFDTALGLLDNRIEEIDRYCSP